MLLSATARSTKQGMRKFSQDINAPEFAQAVALWTKISYGSIALVGVVGTVVMYGQIFGEHHHHHPPAYTYLKIRTKPFPWAESDCGLFEFECKRMARLAAQGIEGAGEKLQLLRRLQLEQDGVSRYVVESAETAEVQALSQSGFVPNPNHKQKRSLGEQLGQRLTDIREQSFPHGNKIDPAAAFGFRWQLSADDIKLLDVLTHKDLRFVIREYDGSIPLQDIIDDATSSDPGSGKGSVAALRPGSITLGRFNRLELIDPLSDALVVGDANLTFSLLLAQHRQDLGHAGQTVATTFEQVPTLRERYKEIDETIKQLQGVGAQVLHNVDCTRLGVDSRFQGMVGKFGSVYYNFPHAGAVRGFFDNHPFVRWRHENLMHLFFRALRNFVKPGASVKVSSNRRAQGVRYSDIFGAASLNEFAHVETVPFPEWTLRKYGRSYGDKRDENKRLKDGEIYAAQQASYDMVYCFCYAPSGVPLAKPHVRCPPTKRDLMSANEGALANLSGDRKKNKVDELTQMFLSYVQGIHVG